jgi:hypothetical protein
LLFCALMFQNLLFVVCFFAVPVCWFLFPRGTCMLTEWLAHCFLYAVCMLLDAICTLFIDFVVRCVEAVCKLFPSQNAHVNWMKWLTYITILTEIIET